MDQEIKNTENGYDADVVIVSFTIDGVTIELTRRESQCMHLLCRGLTSKYIARKLGLSNRTVEGYIDNIRSKTNSRSKSELIELYYEESHSRV